MAGFRNVLVHGYLQVDLQILERVLREKLPDLEEFANQIEAYLWPPLSGAPPIRVRRQESVLHQ